MMNGLWMFMILGGIGLAILTGRVELVANSIVIGGEQAVTLALALLAVLPFWMGMARVAEKARLLRGLARLLSPLLRPFFPSLKQNEEALRYVVLNFAANLLGLGNAATPFGLRAMAAMQSKNSRPDEATDAMCTLLVLNTAGLTLVPTSVIALRAAAGSGNPTATVGMTFFAGLLATACGLVVDFILRSHRRRGSNRGGDRR